MKNAVIIKSFKNGLSVNLDPDLDFGSLYTEVGKKFRESAKFFGNAQMIISFEGRELDSEEERLLLGTISDNSDLSIICLIGHDEDKQQQYVIASNKFSAEPEKNNVQYYKGTVRGGETIETDADLIILGDVNPGAEVISKGSVTVLGTIYGTVRAGYDDNRYAMIIALELKPSKLQIGDLSTKSIEKKTGIFKTKQNPKIVYVKDELIISDNITIEALEKMPY